jgi:amino acid transporter/nucleotide-binding universal stress UspA family protein
MLAHGARPRQLRWFHAGPMLFGDWGTSRLYVLGLAFYYAGHASFWFMAAMSLLLVAVGWAYQVICRLHPDGGGVYSSARERSQTLAVIGALLLCADYIVTASLSALDAFHYFGVHVEHAGLWAAAAIGLVGVVNYFGPTKAGTMALVIAVLTMVCSLIVAMCAGPSLSHARIAAPAGAPVDWWRQFTAIILAISGVEAVANMTGIMVQPVQRTSRLAIWPVLIEIVVLNVVLTAAMLALPTEVIGAGGPNGTSQEVRDTMLKILAAHYVGPAFASVAAAIFALLLLSAVNTAVTDLVSIQFMMARDKELPRPFSGLNPWGMPVLPLVVGTIAPMIVVLVAPDVGRLADLYAIGVVGAVALNLGSCSTNPRSELKLYERIAMTALALLMAAIWVTIAYEKPHALAFAATIMIVGLAARWTARHREQIGTWVEAKAPALARATSAATAATTQLAAKAASLTRKTRVEGAPQTRILVASRGNPKLLHFAIEQARLCKGELLVLFVRHVAVSALGSSVRWELSEDAEAVELFAEVKERADAAGVPVYFLYAPAYDVADAILETAATYAVDTLLLGTTRRGALWRAMKGDVIQQVAASLPERISLLIHAG